MEKSANILEQYFYDLYGIFLKNLAAFVIEAEPDKVREVRLNEMLKEMIKVKRLMERNIKK